MQEYVWAGYDVGHLTELRVHGAGATPIPHLLDSDVYVRVAGDDTAGFYRVPKSDWPQNLDADDPRWASFNLCHTDTGTEGQVEAYHWGSLSAGGGWKAFWVLLLPFALINLAGWNSPRSSRLTQRLVRLFGLITSIALVYWITAISIGVLNECGPGSLCAERKWYLGLADVWLFKDQPSRLALIGLLLGVLVTFALWWWPGRRSADRYERYTPHDEPTSEDADEETQAMPGNALSIDGAGLWYSERSTKKLAAAHVLAMLAAIAAGAFVAVGNTGQLPPASSEPPYFLAYPEDPLAIALLAICVATIVSCGVYVIVLNPLAKESAADNRRQRRRGDPGVKAFILGSFLVLAAAIWIWSAGVAGESSSITDIRLAVLNNIYQRYANTGFVILVVLILGVAAALLVVRLIDLIVSRRRANRYGMAGFGPALLPATALVILAAMVSGAILFVADLFGEPDYEIASVTDLGVLESLAQTELDFLRSIELEDPISRAQLAQLQRAFDAIGRHRDLEADLGEPIIRLGSEYYLMPLMFMIIVGVLLLIALFIAGSALARIPARGMFKQSRIDRPIVRAVNRVRPNDGPSRSLLQRQIAALLRKPYRNRRLHALLALPALALVFLLLLLWQTEAVTEGADALDVLLRPAVWLTVGVFTALAFAVRSYYSGGAARGVLGGVWDIVTFWPRFYHPFAPPSYAVRSVPEISERVRELAADDGYGSPRRVVVSAHSQGVPTTLAALSLISDGGVRSRISLLTYGSPTGMLYSRFFPDYYDAARLDRIGQSLRDEDGSVRWSNLWRLTDWTGGYALGPSEDKYFDLVPVFASGEEDASVYIESVPDLGDAVGEYRLSDPDPHVIGETTVTDPLPSPVGHGDYLHFRMYNDFRQKLVDALYVGSVDRAPAVQAIERDRAASDLVDNPPEGEGEKTADRNGGGDGSPREDPDDGD